MDVTLRGGNEAYILGLLEQCLETILSNFQLFELLDFPYFYQESYKLMG